MSAVRSRSCTGLLPRLNLAGPTHVQQRLFSFLSFFFYHQTSPRKEGKGRTNDLNGVSPTMELKMRREG